MLACLCARSAPHTTNSGKPAGVLEQKTRKHFDAVKAKGLPLGVQIVGLPHRDEVRVGWLLLRVMSMSTLLRRSGGRHLIASMFAFF